MFFLQKVYFSQKRKGVLKIIRGESILKPSPFPPPLLPLQDPTLSPPRLLSPPPLPDLALHCRPCHINHTLHPNSYALAQISSKKVTHSGRLINHFSQTVFVRYFLNWRYLYSTMAISSVCSFGLFFFCFEHLAIVWPRRQQSMTSFELVVTLWNHIGTVGEKNCELKVLDLALFGLLPSIHQPSSHLLGPQWPYESRIFSSLFKIVTVAAK